ncbi:MAG: transposase [Bdellovibrionales bacterium]|nr:transposase [Bdellovibrionales bacterium]
MPRKPIIRSDNLPYHVSGRSNNKEWFYLEMPEVWDIFSEKLLLVSMEYGAQVIAFVLMHNHYHLLLTTPRANLDRIMNYLMREVSRSIGKKSGRINHVFGGRYYWSLIDNALYFSHAYRYVYRNPVEAGICRSVGEFAFSTYKYLGNIDSPPFPLHDYRHRYFCTIPHHLGQRGLWLNQNYEDGEADLIRRALRKPVMRFRTSRREHAVTIPLILSTGLCQKERGT